MTTSQSSRPAPTSQIVFVLKKGENYKVRKTMEGMVGFTLIAALAITPHDADVIFADGGAELRQDFLRMFGWGYRCKTGDRPTSTHAVITRLSDQLIEAGVQARKEVP